MARIGDLLSTLLRRRTPDGDPLPDSVLLDRFTRTRDPAAFELLVWRHGPMVLAACRRMLRDSHAAEDAFQAAFLILAKKAGSVRGSAAGWLHRVALRVCLRLKRRLPAAPIDADPMSPATPDTVEAAERSAILDQEVARLPEWLRVPVVVCYLQGHTTERAAEVLAIPRGTVLSRLATARKRLAVRLTARGVALLAAAAVVPDLSADTGRAVAESAVGFALGQSTYSVPVQLALEVLTMTKRTTIGLVAATLILTAGLSTGVGFVTAQVQAAKPTPATAQKDKPSATPAADDKEPVSQTERVRERLSKMLTETEKQLSAVGNDDVNTLRQRLQVAEQVRADLTTRVLRERSVMPVELEDEMTKAEERMAAARNAAVPADVLAEATKLHPKVTEVQKKLSAKEDELRASKLPKDNAGRKKLDEERVALFKEMQATQEQVGPEVKAYLRTPGIVEVKKVQASVERKFQQFALRAEATRTELDMIEKEVADLRAKLAKLEPISEDVTWLKEKRKRLKQELLELELKELGIGK